MEAIEEVEDFSFHIYVDGCHVNSKSMSVFFWGGNSMFRDFGWVLNFETMPRKRM